jgi:hypothetical protein
MSAQPCVGYARTHGEIAGERLSLHYDGICVQSSLLAQPAPGSQAPPQPKSVRCQATLALNKERNALEGPLRCEGLPTVLAMRLPFG